MFDPMLQAIVTQAQDAALRRAGITGGVRLAGDDPGMVVLMTPAETWRLSLSGYVGRIVGCRHAGATTEALGMAWCQACSTAVVWERGAMGAGDSEGS